MNRTGFPSRIHEGFRLCELSAVDTPQLSSLFKMVDIVEKKRGPSPPKGPAIGRGSPGSGIGIDEVSANRIWKEHCSKVEAMISMPGDFQFNPLTSKRFLIPITDDYPFS